MSNPILVSEFTTASAPIIKEARALNQRLIELRKDIEQIMNNVVPNPVEDEDYERERFVDMVYEAYASFYTSIDYENSSIEFGNVEVWEASNC